MRLTLTERFWLKVNQSPECWQWTGSRSQSGTGYGSICSGGKRGKLLGAHRVSWEIHFGPIPAKVRVLHRCDNRGCVNPWHLFLGSQSDNLCDASAKGRLWNQKLDHSSVIEIRRSREKGESSTVVAKRFGISAAHVRKVAAKKAQAHV